MNCCTREDLPTPAPPSMMTRYGTVQVDESLDEAREHVAEDRAEPLGPMCSVLQSAGSRGLRQ